MMKGCVLIYEIDFTHGEKLFYLWKLNIQRTEKHLSDEHPGYADVFS